MKGCFDCLRPNHQNSRTPISIGPSPSISVISGNKRQLTQEQLAARAEISAKYVSLIESSSFTNPPTLEVLFDLAASLEVEPFQLFKPL